MLEIFTSVRRIDFQQLIQVYEESIKKDGMELYSHLDDNRQVLEAEQDFYRFLSDFLRIPGAFYALWTVDGSYRAALRIEPYKDGALLTGLETATGVCFKFDHSNPAVFITKRNAQGIFPYFQSEPCICDDPSKVRFSDDFRLCGFS